MPDSPARLFEDAAFADVPVITGGVQRPRLILGWNYLNLQMFLFA